MPAVSRRRSAPQHEPWRDRFQEGLQFIGQQQHGEALRALSQALVDAPEEELASCYAMRGYAYLCSGDFSRAVEDCQLAIEHDCSEGEAFAWRGSAYAGLGQWRRAIDDYIEAIRLSPEKKEEYRQVALTHVQNGLPTITSSLHNNPTAQIYQDRGVLLSFAERWEEACRDFSHAVQLDPTDALSFFRRAECFAATERHDRVANDCSQAIRLGYKHAPAYFLRGTALRALGKTEKAVSDLTKARQLAPEWGEVYFERAQALEANGQLEEAIEEYEAAARALPQVADVHARLGTLRASQEDHFNAVADFSRALEIISLDTLMLLARGGSYLALGELELARADFESAIALDSMCGPGYRGKGNVLAMQGDDEGAHAEFSRAIRLDTKDAAAYLDRGDVCFRDHRLDDAVADYSKSLRFSEDEKLRTTVFRRRGEAYLSLGRFEEAAADFTQVIDRRPQADAYAGRGSARANLGRWREAIDDIGKAVELNPLNSEEYMELGRPCSEAAIEHFTAAIEADPKPRLYRDRGVAYHFRGELNKAFKDYSAAVQLDTGDVESFLRRGGILAVKKQYEHAVADFTRVLMFDPDRASALYQRGNCLKALGKKDKALADFTAAIKLEPKQWLYFLARGQVFASGGRPDKAELDLSRAIQYAPQHSQGYLARGLVRAAQGKSQEALADFSQAIERSPESPVGHLRKAEVYQSLRKHNQALAEYDAAIEIDPMHIEAWCDRGLLFARRGQFEQAIIELTKAGGRIRHDIRFAAAFETRARVAYNMGRFRQALADYEIVLSLQAPDFDFSKTHYGRGLALLQIEELAAAEEAFASAVKLKPKYQAARTALAWIQGDRQNIPPELKRPDKTYPPAKPPVANVQLAVQPQPQWQVEPLWDQWILRTASGAEYGPVAKAKLDQWTAQGRLCDQSLLLRIDWDNWRPATEIYFELTHQSHRSSNRPIPLAAVPEEPAQPYAEYEPAEETPPAEEEGGSPEIESQPESDEGFPGIQL